ncbi:hypothetical protein J3458_008876 [Metarhizium acridum]|uniref:uncharacterized protein n=1 Tax=Metarhizium acridum TaxID=92637 RepID=UPI001C6AACB7|nr:hypothetical protein J3458_008876 [Metarhizium acridum]
MPSSYWMPCLRDISFRPRLLPAIHATFPRIIALLNHLSLMEHQNKQLNRLIKGFRSGYLKNRARGFLYVQFPIDSYVWSVDLTTVILLAGLRKKERKKTRTESLNTLSLCLMQDAGG